MVFLIVTILLLAMSCEEKDAGFVSETEPETEVGKVTTEEVSEKEDIDAKFERMVNLLKEKEKELIARGEDLDNKIAQIEEKLSSIQQVETRLKSYQMVSNIVLILGIVAILLGVVMGFRKRGPKGQEPKEPLKQEMPPEPPKKQEPKPVKKSQPKAANKKQPAKKAAEKTVLKTPKKETQKAKSTTTKPKTPKE